MSQLGTATPEPTNQEERGGGIWGSIGRLPTTFAKSLQNRIELFSVEFEEQKLRVIQSILLGVLAVSLAILAIALFTVVVIFLVAPPYRLWVAAGFGLIYLGSAATLFLLVNKELQTQPFAETINQIKKDAACLRKAD